MSTDLRMHPYLSICLSRNRIMCGITIEWHTAHLSVAGDKAPSQENRDVGLFIGVPLDATATIWENPQRDGYLLRIPSHWGQKRKKI